MIKPVLSHITALLKINSKPALYQPPSSFKGPPCSNLFGVFCRLLCGIGVQQGCITDQAHRVDLLLSGRTSLTRAMAKTPHEGILWEFPKNQGHQLYGPELLPSLIEGPQNMGPPIYRTSHIGDTWNPYRKATKSSANVASDLTRLHMDALLTERP